MRSPKSIIRRAKRAMTAGDVGRIFSSLLEVVGALRKHCPWDRAQRVQDLRFKLIEEAYEAVDSFDRQDVEGFASELGDILLVVLLMIRIMEEEGKFDVVHVMRKLIAKLVERHPHVFGDREMKTAEAVLQNWEKMKGEVKKSDFSLFMPSLYLAHRLIERIKNKEDVEVTKLKEKIFEDLRFILDGSAESRNKAIIILLRSVFLLSLEGVNPEDELRKLLSALMDKLSSVKDLSDLVLVADQVAGGLS